MPSIKINPSLAHNELTHLFPWKFWFQQNPTEQAGSNKPLLREDESVFPTPSDSFHLHKEISFELCQVKQHVCWIEHLWNTEFSRIFTFIQIIKIYIYKIIRLLYMQLHLLHPLWIWLCLLATDKQKHSRDFWNHSRFPAKYMDMNPATSLTDSLKWSLWKNSPHTETLPLGLLPHSTWRHWRWVISATYKTGPNPAGAVQ